MDKYAEILFTIGRNGYSCAHCGRRIGPNDLMTDCSDCAAVFCEKCVRDGTFDNHQCEDYDWGDDDE